MTRSHLLGDVAAKSGRDSAAAGGKGLFSTACFLTDVPIPSAVSSPSQSPVRDRDASGVAGAAQEDGRTSGKCTAGCGGGQGAASVWVDGDTAEAGHILASDVDIACVQLGFGGDCEAEERGSDVLLCQADLRGEAGLSCAGGGTVTAVVFAAIGTPTGNFPFANTIALPSMPVCKKFFCQLVMGTSPASPAPSGRNNDNSRNNSCSPSRGCSTSA